MADQHHIIKRQVLEFELRSDSYTGQGLQQEISEVYRSRVIPVLEKTLDRLSNQEDSIGIERLEIDLGELNIGNLAEEFPKQVEEILYRALGESIQSVKLEDELKLQGISMQRREDVNISISTLAEAKAGILITFLRTGRMPWNAGHREQGKRFSQLLEELLEEAPRQTAKVVKSELKHTLQQRRFIHQTPDRVISRALSVTADDVSSGSGEKGRIRPLIKFARIVLEVSRKEKLFQLSNYNQWRLGVWSQVIGIVLGRTGRREMTDKQLEEKIQAILREGFHFRTTQLSSRHRLQVLKKIAAELSTYSGEEKIGVGKVPVRAVGQLIQEFRSELGEEPASEEKSGGTGRSTGGDKESPEGFKSKSEEQKEEKSEDESATEGLAESSDEKANKDEEGDGSTKMKDSTREGSKIEQSPPDDQKRLKEKEGREGETDPGGTDESPEEELHRSYRTDQKADEAWIHNAGLVLLHPFIVSLFERTRLLEEKQFVNQDAQERAVHLLQYLVTGEQETPEEELFLNKLLCGLDPEFPVLPGIEITVQEEQECENLLKEVVRRWQALKNSSPEAVRTTFLQREGLVNREGLSGGWKVTIERNTFDVLLDRLPWGISIFKMPWNSFLIHVEW